MVRNYCTLFDSTYLPQGLVLYESLMKHSSEPFALFVLPMDEACFETLSQLFLPNLHVVLGFHSMHHGMEEARANRSHKEYCWTCASNLCEALLEIGLEEITYLDADMMFFSDPAPVFGEIGNKSIAITPHRLIPSKKHLERNGLFNVGWVTFRNTPAGSTCASTWASQCRERCSENYGCGDQFYLNEWPTIYKTECHIIDNIGVNAGPWSIGNWVVTPGPKLSDVPLVLYHYHELSAKSDGTFRLTNYDLRPEDIKFIYEPYLSAYKQMLEHLSELTVE